MRKLLTLGFIVLITIGVQATPDHSVDPKKHYEKAFKHIKKMLKGQAPLSFRDAVFLTENAYLEGNLNYTSYLIHLHAIINDVKAIRKRINFPYDYFDKGSVYTNAAIFQYFTDTLIYQDSAGNVIAQKKPYVYNFDDPLGEKEWKNMFVSSLLKGHKGNCHSLPYLYQIIANDFEVESHLVIAPNHLYITHLCHDPSITWYNTELTSGTHPIDAWIKINTYMSMEAIRSGIYGVPLNQEQSVALTLVDLANGYLRKFPDDDEQFALDCVNLALQHFPLCINAMLLKLNLLGEVYRLTEDEQIRLLMDKLATQIHQLGYDEMPKEMYEDWLSGKREYDPNYTPFKELNQKKGTEGISNGRSVLTASNGRYLEYHWTDSLELIGHILYDTKHKKVAQILNIDTSDLVSRIPRDIFSRWLSPDPLEAKYPNMSPYNFVGGNPILYIDPDGREIWIHYVNEEGTKLKVQYKDGILYDKKGNEVLVNNSFVNDVVASIEYLKPADEKGVINKIENHKRKINIVQTDELGETGAIVGGYGSGKVKYNPNGGVKVVDGKYSKHPINGKLIYTTTPNGEKLTPALGLYHEFGHIFEALFNRKAQRKRKKTKDSDYPDVYHNEEERYIIQEYEAPMAKKLREGVRDNHHGIPYETEGPTTTKEKVDNEKTENK